MRKERARDIKRESKILNVQKRYKYVNYEMFLLKIKYNKEYVHYETFLIKIKFCSICVLLSIQTNHVS